MDDPGLDDPGLCWPFWKFGLKRDDLYGQLHDKFNTFQSSIQDPEAFHHDVFEISKDASSTDEFYRLLADRKEQRIRELNESLEAAALEIIANPSLIGTERWEHAAQLFRTRSLDSLVRYFASYLPINHRWHKTCYDSSSASETCSTVDSIANSHGSIFDGIDDGPIMTDEPLSLSTSLHFPSKSHLPPSPRSMTMCSDSSAASPIDERHHEYPDTLTPARTLSLSESDLGSCDLHIDAHCHEETSQLDAETPASEVSDVGSFEILDRLAANAHLGDYEDELPSQPDEDTFRRGTPADVLESDTPTPRPEQSAKGFFDTKPSPNPRRHRSASPARLHAHSFTHSHIHRFHHPHMHHDAIRAALQPRRRREGSPGQGRWRSPGDPTARISKPSPEPMRSKARASRRHEV